MSNIYGRQVVLVLTNKSGGSVAAGDVVIVDTTNNEAFTTSTAGAVTGGVGIAQESIANNASGRVLMEGYAALVNVNASVTRGNYGKTHTVVKQATDAGASRTVGTFCQFLTGGTTPTARVYPPDVNASSGAVATDAIFDAKGDLAVGTGADTAQKLTVGANGKVPVADSAQTTGLKYDYPPGYEFDYVAFTGNVSITHTTEGTSDTVVTGSSVSYDGSTKVMIEFFAPCISVQATAGASCQVLLYEDSTLIGWWGQAQTPAANNNSYPTLLRLQRTPSNASHQYIVKAMTSSGTSTVKAGTGGTGAFTAGYIRITKA